MALDAEDWARPANRSGFGPEDEFEWRDRPATTVRRAAEEDLANGSGVHGLLVLADEVVR